MKSQAATKGHERVDRTTFNQNLQNIHPGLRYITNMAVKDESQGATENEDLAERRVDTYKLKRLSDYIANNTNANIDLNDITPYIGKAKTIFKTLIMYPNGLRKNIFNYGTLDTEIKNSKLHELLMKPVMDYYNNAYKIESYLPEAIEETTCGSGSKTILTIPRPALDHIINGNALAKIDGIEGLTPEGRTDLAMRTIKQELDKEFVYQESKPASLKHTDEEGNTVALEGPLDRPHFRARNIGLIRDPKASPVTGMESLFTGTVSPKDDLEFPLLSPEFGITITDNPAVLIVKDVNQRITDMQRGFVDGMESLSSVVEARMRKGRSTESEKKDSPNPSSKTKILGKAQQEALQNVFDDNRNYQARPVMSMKQPNVYSDDPYGIPLTFDLPATAFIPCFMHGNLKRRVGGFVMIAENGGFLNTTHDAIYGSETGAGGIDTKAGAGTTIQLTEQLRRIQLGERCNFDMSEFIRLTKIQLKRELAQAIASGSDGAQISVEVEDSILKMFLENSFQRQRTRVLYVPEAYFVYMTLNTNKYGFGESFTTKARSFISRLGAIDVADALAQLNNAQTLNELTIALQSQDVNPMHTIALARGEWFESNPTVHNILSSGLISIPDIVDALKQQSLIAKVEPGDNKFFRAPTTSVQQIERVGFKGIDDNARQHLLNQIANTFTLPRAWLDERDDTNNFQVEALAEQDSLRNQTIMWQETISGFFTELIRKDLWLNGTLKNKLIDIILENKGEYRRPDDKHVKLEGKDTEIISTILTDFINGIYVELPEPATMESIGKLRDKLDGVNELVDKWLETAGTAKMMGPMLERMGIDTSMLDPQGILDQCKALFNMKAMKLYNIPSPFDEVTNKGLDGGMLSLFLDLDMQEENITNFLVTWLNSTAKRDKRYKKRLDDAIERKSKALDGTPGEAASTEGAEGEEQTGEIPLEGDEFEVVEPKVPGEEGNTEEKPVEGEVEGNNENANQEPKGDGEDDFNIKIDVPN